MLSQDVEKLKQAFGDREFTGKAMMSVLNLHHFSASGSAIKQLRNQGLIAKTDNGYRFVAFAMPTSTPSAVTEPCRKPTLTELAAETERALMDANQEIAELKAKLDAIRGAL